MALFFNQLINGIGLASIYAIFAAGFALVFGTLGVLNLAHGIVGTSAALCAIYTASNWGVSLWPALAIGVVAGAVIGLIVEVIAFRPVRKRGASMTGTLITSIGAALALRSLLQTLTKSNPQPFPLGFFSNRTWDLGALAVRPSQVIALVAAAIVFMLLDLLVYRSTFGRSMRALGHDAQSIEVVGINPDRIASIASVISGALAGLAVSLVSLNLNSADFGTGDSLLLKGFAAVILGGLGSIRGAVLGALAIGVSEVLVAQYVSNSLRDAITFGVLLAYLVVKPTGFLKGTIGEVRA